MAVGRERGMIVCTLDAVMKARGVKGKDLARTVGMSEVNLSRVKRGKARMVKLATWRRYAGSFDASRET